MIEGVLLVIGLALALELICNVLGGIIDRVKDHKRAVYFAKWYAEIREEEGRAALRDANDAK